MFSWISRLLGKAEKREDPLSNMDKMDLQSELREMKMAISQYCAKEPLRIVLCGTAGSGKSSLVNNITSALRGKAIYVANSALTETHVTEKYVEYTVLSSETNIPILVVCDTRGMCNTDTDVALVKEALKGKFASNQDMDNAATMTMEGQSARNKQAVYVVFVVDANMATGASKPAETTFTCMHLVQTFAQKESIPMCVVVTKCDKLDAAVRMDMTNLYKSEMVDKARRIIQDRFQYLPKYRIFPFVNNTEQMELEMPMVFNTFYVLKHIVSDVESYMRDVVPGVLNSSSQQQ